MCPYDCQKTIFFQEHLSQLFAKNYRAVPQVIVIIQLFSSSLLTLSRIRPKQITHNSFKRNFKHSIFFNNLFKFNCLRRNASMYTKVLIVNNTSKWQGIKYVHYAKVKILIVLFTALLIKVKALSHLPRFMVTSQHENVILILDFHCHQQDDDLHSERASIDIITQKQKCMLGIIIDIRTETEDFHEVPKLTMNVTNDGDGLRFDEYIGFVLDNVMEANNDVFYKLEWYRFFLVKTLLQVGEVDLSISGLQVFDVNRLLFLHDVWYQVGRIRFIDMKLCGRQIQMGQGYN